MVTETQVRAFLAGSTRPPGMCLGTVGNDMTGHFGSYPHQPGSATEAANSLEARGELHTTPCPAAAHFDFYHFVENGVDLGHIDYHVGALHYANSTRCTVWLNAGRTVGTYPSWPRVGESRRGWSYLPASLDYMPPLTGLATASAGEAPLGTNASKGNLDMELYGTTTPATVPPKYLALNAGLVGNKATYMLFPSGQMPRVTQDQNLAAEWSSAFMGQPSPAGIVQASWAWADQMFDQAVTVLAPSAPATVTGGDNAQILAALEQINTTLAAIHIPTKITGTLG